MLAPAWCKSDRQTLQFGAIAQRDDNLNTISQRKFALYEAGPPLAMSFASLINLIRKQRCVANFGGVGIGRHWSRHFCILMCHLWSGLRWGRSRFISVRLYNWR